MFCDKGWLVFESDSTLVNLAYCIRPAHHSTHAKISSLAHTFITCTCTHFSSSLVHAHTFIAVLLGILGFSSFGVSRWGHNDIRGHIGCRSQDTPHLFMQSLFLPPLCMKHLEGVCLRDSRVSGFRGLGVSDIPCAWTQEAAASARLTCACLPHIVHAITFPPKLS